MLNAAKLYLGTTVLGDRYKLLYAYMFPEIPQSGMNNISQNFYLILACQHVIICELALDTEQWLLTGIYHHLYMRHIKKLNQDCTL